ncbi:MAG: hypothetical protein DSM107014_14980 [Gomphosphaeria aponina SAG 52.96 = DSM 107014]|uniref:Uncharacterized protein n=1 Tax=Gomphosphaeria aponina SAG 52.96 = DSM 107014 TaxID=1521640 RepID=A0A941GXN4_9CHRO|nr:hypothetical protein [Gomphosphaeria aponina SAG 52.96 = DSM 107014]
MTQLTLDPVTGKIGLTENNDTPSVLWDQAVQEAVVETSLRPTIASRA